MRPQRRNRMEIRDEVTQLLLDFSLPTILNVMAERCQEISAGEYPDQGRGFYLDESDLREYRQNSADLREAAERLLRRGRVR